jgi:uncharacterized protein YndB with AHSA1/START domain
MAESVSATVHIAAPAEKVWAMVTDLPRMGEWSPENRGGRWLGGATAAAPGARFKGSNANGKRKWSTTTKIEKVESPTYFSFLTTVGPITAARWSYRVTPAGDGCDVTEQWDDLRGPMKPLSALATGVKDRAGFNQRSMEETLAKLKAAAEG